jgi:hypothetical protein
MTGATDERMGTRAMRMFVFTVLSGVVLSACSDLTAPESDFPASVQIVPVGTIGSINEDVSLTARVFDPAGRELPGAILDWEVSNPEILEPVSPGVFRSRANGNATVRARVRSGSEAGSPAGGHARTGPAAELTIRVQQAAARIDFGEAPLNLWSINQVVQLHAVVLDARGTPVADAPPITWSTPGGTVISIAQDGRVRAVGDGSTTIMAVAGGVTGTSPVAVYSTIPYETCFSFSVAGMGNPLGKCATVSIGLREVD